MNIKLKLKIQILNKVNNQKLKNFVKIKFIEKDKRFEYDFNDQMGECYSSMIGLDIAVSRTCLFGNINNTIDRFYIPIMDKMGTELEKEFITDDDRYTYLKHLYVALKEWANNWYGFNDDRESCIEIIGDEWIIGNL